MPAEVLVLGAGMVGVTAALALQQRGHHVVLADRRGPGYETSYGNAGIIQREAVRPYAFPRDGRALARIALGRSNEAHYHWAGVARMAPRLLRYWHASRPANYARIAQAYSRLIEHCLSEHEVLIGAAGADDLVRKTGWLQLFRSQARFDAMAEISAATCQHHVLAADVLDASGVAKRVPALRRPLETLTGAIHWKDAWSVQDPGELVSRYAKLFATRGGEMARADAATLHATKTGWAVRSEGRVIEAEHAVIALGPWSDLLCHQLGYCLPLFVKRGYHRHYTVPVSLHMPMLDTERGIMLAPMRSGLRVLTGAEFADHDASPTPLQLRRGAIAAQELIELGEPVEDVPWMGARPCTVDMLPVVGAAPRHPRLWFDFGHAHHGFTLGPVTGRMVAELISGEKPFIEPDAYSADRFA